MFKELSFVLAASFGGDEELYDASSNVIKFVLQEIAYTLCNCLIQLYCVNQNMLS